MKLCFICIVSYLQFCPSTLFHLPVQSRDTASSSWRTLQDPAVTITQFSGAHRVQICAEQEIIFHLEWHDQSISSSSGSYDYVDVYLSSPKVSNKTRQAGLMAECWEPSPSWPGHRPPHQRLGYAWRAPSRSFLTSSGESCIVSRRYVREEIKSIGKRK